MASSRIAEDIVVNCAGKAIADPQRHRAPKQYVSALAPWSRAIRDVLKVGLSPRGSLQLTDEERALTQVDRYLVVGYAYPDAEKSVLYSQGSSKRAVGTTRNPGELLKVGDQALWFVVAKVVSNRPIQLHLYVLTEPSEEGLCRPMPIRKKEVFFFYEYRDTTTGGSNREIAWSNKILVDCVVPVPDPSSLTVEDNNNVVKQEDEAEQAKGLEENGGHSLNVEAQETAAVEAESDSEE